MKAKQVRFRPGDLTISIRYEGAEKIVFATGGEDIERAFNVVAESLSQKHVLTPEQAERAVRDFMTQKREQLVSLTALMPDYGRVRRLICLANMWYIFFRARVGQLDASRGTAFTVDWTAETHPNGVPIVRISRAINLPAVPRFDMWA